MNTQPTKKAEGKGFLDQVEGKGQTQSYASTNTNHHHMYKIPQNNANNASTRRYSNMYKDKQGYSSKNRKGSKNSRPGSSKKDSSAANYGQSKLQEQIQSFEQRFRSSYGVAKGTESYMNPVRGRPGNF
jgi:hypothetical protein